MFAELENTKGGISLGKLVEKKIPVLNTTTHTSKNILKREKKKKQVDIPV